MCSKRALTRDPTVLSNSREENVGVASENVDIENKTLMMSWSDLRRVSTTAALYVVLSK